MDNLALDNAKLAVELDPRRPAVLGYRVKPSGLRLDGARPEGVLRINGQIVPWSQWQVAAKSEGGAVVYDLRHGQAQWRLSFRFRLDGSTLVMTMAVAEDPAKTLKTIAFQDLFLISCPHTDFSFWRENWYQGAWNAFPPWPEAGHGGYACNKFQRQLLRDAIPDLAPQPTLHACFFDGKLCGFVKTNYLHLPLVTQALLSDRHGERCGAYAIAPNTYQYRVRNQVMPPLEAKVVVLEDTNGDGKANESDYHLWLNRSFPSPDPLYKKSVWYKVFNAKRLGDVSTTFKQTLEIIEAIHHVTDHLPQVAYLTGWQYDGHDTGFPSHDKLNPVLGTREDLLELVRVAKERFNCVISYHANVDDAYQLYPGWDEGILCRDVDGKIQPYMVFDERQSYHICHTKDVESGKIFKRLDAMLKLIPVEKTIHLDAFRYSNHSWDGDQFIGSMEELACGVQPILAYFKAHGIDVSLEALNNWACDGPGMFSAVWHLDEWWKLQIYHGKILGGGRYRAIGGWGLGMAINNDFDFAMLQNDWPVILDYLYLGTLLYHFYLEREIVEMSAPPGQLRWRFNDGVQVELEERKERLQVTWGDLTIASGHDRFIPLKGAIYVYSRDGGEKTWKLPADWRGVPLEIVGLSRSGRQPAPPHKLTGDSLWIRLPPRSPVKLMRK
jgi:hypothetical protein